MVEHAIAPRPNANSANEDRQEVLPNNAGTPRPVLRFHYEVASVEKASAPYGGQGADWYRYVLSSGNSRIVGLRRGTCEEVTAYASTCAEDFNFRGATGKSKAAAGYTKK
jgi:hypothetical protein